jgi:hypothetical protein
MAISYKEKWQEATEKNARLTWEIERLTEEAKRLRQAILASGDDNLIELERTRQVVDLAGIARHMRVERFTPQQWKQRDHLPPVDFPDIREPLWYASTIRERFAVPTGRPWYDFTAPEELSPAA